ncbi:bifunctional alpha,alpha-trehalose-phosphate synthase (UDP-forming)/trehalose-phosphatase [Segetibacter aerophilus]|uniref:Bifunctional alpha,alpha-trehalose-phosphate synthase (UDP-forming)/trehalose-phosphatase n=1 Tax=Segetibacter aerophilus TaxID=670293 RepID=A0A512BGH5_9BACT|nr:bifunctional alpha,alpha-trehalose-phosphate synthase (UDP-forming)/trehalose-phosphatase [Segetibacter aerophilus]GEO11064.1 bifunctional alpha,alpha-trehalose-phosphate synthase (UDP-forming)/trehalose-phosphatase [Segetibacter aerophilus]
MSRLVIISNRLPFSLDTSGDKVQIRQSSGGLVSALKGYFEQTGNKQNDFDEKIWVGSCDFSEDDWKENKESLQGADFSIEPIFIEKEVYSDYYNGFSNSTIWPLFHYFPSMTEYKKQEFEAYYKVNQLFADRIIEIMKPDDVIWVHDYQLMILPQMLRQANPEATIGFFLHIPFPTYEIFRLIPREWKTKIMEGLLGADLVGFHTYDYAQYFINSAKMILSLENQYNTLTYHNRLIRADLFPIGIDFDKFKQASEKEEVVAYKDELLQSFGGKKIIFSVDRLDYTKGLTYRLQGFENFLAKYPEWREKIVFILNIIPSRDSIPAYVDRKRIIEEMVSTINGKYSSIQWQPIIYRYNHLPFDELCGLYLAADVALITPLRDGMNLVAKEYVAGSNNGGVLVLSELTGAASELNEACHVNPTDAEEMADAINTALTMPLEEQKQRMQAMQKRLSDYNVVQWVNDFLEQLSRIKKEQEHLKVKQLDRGEVEELAQHYSNANKRCLLLDYDGTMVPLRKIPSAAAPTKEVLTFLEQLAADEKNEVVIISGRDADTLQNWLGHLPLHFIAEHGSVIRYKGGEWKLQSAASTDWKNEIRPMLESYVWRCAGSFLEEKQNTLSWHYRNTHPELGFIRSRELLNNLLQLTTNTPVQVVDGNKVLEVRLTGMDKGVTALKVLNKLTPEFILCIGDDTTDEDMFKALEGKAYTIKVGNGSTAANYNLQTQEEVLPLLKQITELKLVGEKQLV